MQKKYLAFLILSITWALNLAPHAVAEGKPAPPEKKPATTAISTHDKTPASSKARSTESTAPAGSESKNDASAAIKDSDPRLGFHVVQIVDLLGRLDMWVSRDGLKLSSAAVSFIVDAKSLQPIMYNPESKKCKHFKDEASFERVNMVTVRQFSQDKKIKYSKWVKTGQEKLLGYTCDKFARHALNPEKDALFTSSLAEEFVILPWHKFASTDRLLTLVTSLYHLRDSPLNGIWMKRTMIYQEQSVQTKQVTHRSVKNWLTTKSIERTRIDPSIYKLGKGYLEVDDEGDILFGSQMNTPGMSRH